MVLVCLWSLSGDLFFPLQILNKKEIRILQSLYREEVNQKYAAEDGTEYTLECKYLSMEHVQQIAHEFFGVDSFYYNQYYDAERGGYVILPMDFPYDFTYKDLVIEAQTNGNITAEFTLMPSYDETWDYGRYRYEFQLIHEDERTFLFDFCIPKKYNIFYIY